LLSGIAVAAPPPVYPEPAQFTTERMRVPGRLLTVHAEDLDADGRRDLIAIFVQGAPPSTLRKIAIFYDHKSGFRAEPDQILAAPQGASFLDVADVDGDAKKELLFGDSRGIGFFVLGPTGFAETKRLVAIEGLALLADDDDLPYFAVARAWGGDGKIQIFLPTVDRIAVITRGSDGTWSRTGELRLPPRASYAARSDSYEPRARNYMMRVALTVPELSLADWDGDGINDLVAVIDDTVTVFRGQAGGSFAATAAAKIHLGARTEAEAARGNASVQVSVLDLNGDGVADLAVNKVVGGLGSMHAQTGVYLGKKGGGYDRANQVLSRDGFAGALLFADLDGDKRPELIVCHTEISFADTVRIVLTKHLALNFGVYRNHGDKGFSQNADAERRLDYLVDYTAGAELDGPFPSLDGDFNGDGRPDFVGPKEPGTLGVWLGGPKALIDEYPKALVHLPLSRYLQVVDLDGDKRADVVLFYRYAADHQGQIVVLRNTGRGW
jgi:hypothetical protein